MSNQEDISMKGSVLDIVGILLVVVTVIIMVFALGKAFFDIEDNNTGGLLNENVLTPVVNTYHVTFDQAPLILIVGLGLVAVISALFIPSHPIMAIPTIIIFIFLIIGIPALANGFQAMTQDESLTGTIENLRGCGNTSCTQLVINNLPYIFIAIGFMIFIALFIGARGAG